METHRQEAWLHLSAQPCFCALLAIQMSYAQWPQPHTVRCTDTSLEIPTSGFFFLLQSQKTANHMSAPESPILQQSNPRKPE